MLQATFTLCSLTNLNIPAERIHVAANLTGEVAQVEGFTIPDFHPLQY